MHETYSTRGFVLKGRPHKEDSVEALIFTQTLGKVRVVAQAAKRAGATFASAVEPGTFGEYALIRGRYYWRLRGMHDLMQYPFVLPAVCKESYLRVLSLLARLLPEDEQLPELFEEFEVFVTNLSENNLVEGEARMVFKVLVTLGYADRTIDITDTKVLIREVNRGILAAGL